MQPGRKREWVQETSSLHGSAAAAALSRVLVCAHPTIRMHVLSCAPMQSEPFLTVFGRFASFLFFRCLTLRLHGDLDASDLNCCCLEVVVFWTLRPWPKRYFRKGDVYRSLV